MFRHATVKSAMPFTDDEGFVAWPAYGTYPNVSITARFVITFDDVRRILGIDTLRYYQELAVVETVKPKQFGLIVAKKDRTIQVRKRELKQKQLRQQKVGKNKRPWR